ncbi:MAG: anaerobic ribonucleoside-triphosphate reductase activating protein [Aestuariibacter sp.]
MKTKSLSTFAPQILFQEVPDEISLAFTVCGCPLRCEGCHSMDTWSLNNGSELTNELFKNHIQNYQSLVTCVLFFGGEWHSEALIEKLRYARNHQLKTCLYTGLERIPNRISAHLSYLKTGRWIKELGGLDSPFTNQRFVDLDNNKLLNHKFLGESHYVATEQGAYTA